MRSRSFKRRPVFLRINSTPFGDGGRIPEKHAHDHANLSPPLTWRAALGVPYLTIEPAAQAEVVWRTTCSYVLKQAEVVGTYER